jgi:periplasmic protein TonB
MFETALSSSPSTHERSRRGLTTLTSFGLQAAVVAMLLMVPLLRPSGIPLLRQISTPISLGQPEPAPVQPHGPSLPTAGRHNPEIFLRQPSQIPSQIPTGSEAAPTMPSSGPYLPGVGDTGVTHGTWQSVGNGPAPAIPKPPAAAEHPVRLSHMSEGDLIRKIMPAYPPLARSAHIQGTVILQAVISKSGMIENLRLLNGHPMLVPAAIEAVRQWRYRPYVLNGEPVEVETQITVNFALNN